MSKTKCEEEVKKEVDALVGAFAKAAEELVLKDSPLTADQKAIIILRAASAVHINQVIKLDKREDELVDYYSHREKVAKAKSKAKSKITH